MGAVKQRVAETDPANLVRTRRLSHGLTRNSLANSATGFSYREFAPALFPMKAGIAAERDKTTDRLVNVSASGSIVVVPDIAHISIGVRTEATAMREAINRNKAIVAKLIDGMKSIGIAANDMQTSSFNVSSQHMQGKDGRASTTSGHTVTNQVRLTVREVRVRALCSAGVTRPRRSYDPVRLPPWLLPSATFGATTPATDGSPPITRTTFPTCRAHYPGGSSGCACRLLPCSCSLPQMAGGSASALSLSRPAQASRVLRPAGSLSRPRRPLSRGSFRSWARLLIAMPT